LQGTIRTGHFPWFRTLGSSEARILLARLATKLNVAPDGSFIVNTILARSHHVPKCCAEAEGFQLKRLFQHLTISPAPRALINWYRYDEVDEMDFEDLPRNSLDLTW